MLQNFLSAIGWRQLSDWDLFMIVMLGGGVTLLVAFVADMILKGRSYGIIGNSIILIAGAILGLFLLTVVDFAPNRRFYMHAVFGCLLSAVVILLGAVALRRPV
jgi:uncharacterized membrane protein YeaQ/YmgE (transglycosylase-associated protein family)